ncbi:hypothetical protein ABB55_23085 [Prosthecomicrobium hirschii]|uniref:Metal-binding protein n=1 Tax=Prosthecodimorpha hirschii TaxID=665126 RepID=A0A0P6WE54_9HYPH|nr:DUF1636 family protein [Prosthecomicrobium hirschii]KPL54752.1 hypothetical protein ABB55_23085 [Prosthecomicrobium hirschii]
MTARLIVCVTCDRMADPVPPKTRGAALAEAVEARAAARGEALAVTRVDCLDGCPRPCNAALKARGKPLRRFSNLSPAMVDALIDAARAYAADRDGRLPPDLAARLGPHAR